MNPIYWRIYKTDDEKIEVIPLRYGDEWNYDQDSFLTDKSFDKEADAHSFLISSLIANVYKLEKEMEASKSKIAILEKKMKGL